MTKVKVKLSKKRERELRIVLLDLEDACNNLERHLRLLEECFYNFIDSSTNPKKTLNQMGTLSEIFEPVIFADLEEIRAKIREARFLENQSLSPKNP
jgi:hypothetical protein